MQSKKPKVSADSLCGALGPDDGIDPKILFRKDGRRKARNRKTLQLCKEVFRALTLAIGALEDQPWAGGLIVGDVAPAPDASRLRVTVAFTREVNLDHAENAIAGLVARSGGLRAEIAAAIHRKRVPELTFALEDMEASDDA